jgi:hypothetical protein
MAAGVMDQLWSMGGITELVEAAAPEPSRPATYKSARVKMAHCAVLLAEAKKVRHFLAALSVTDDDASQ